MQGNEWWHEMLRKVIRFKPQKGTGIHVYDLSSNILCHFIGKQFLNNLSGVGTRFEGKISVKVYTCQNHCLFSVIAHNTVSSLKEL